MALVNILKWLTASSLSIAWVWAAWHSRSPYFLMARDGFFWMWILFGSAALLWLVFGKRRAVRRFRARHLLAAAALMAAVFAGRDRFRHYQNRELVLATPAGKMPGIGNHLMVGWLGFEETRALAAKGAIAGVFLNRRDFPKGVTIPEIRRTVDALQLARREAGLPVLWIATDQEGGTVEKMSPPLPKLPALKDLIETAGPEEMVRVVTEYAEAQGKALADAGFNMNFAPVVDLMPAHAPDALDFHSRIATRALSADPAIVALAGEAYVKGMERHGVMAVLKHFPGLGRVPADTHHFAAALDTPAAVLDENDWVPFREISRSTNAGVMLSHVRVTALDADQPASCSAAAVRLLRDRWGVKGMLVTDDFSMAPISHGRGGMVAAARRGMAAGVDLILLSYDGEAVYDLLGEELAGTKKPDRFPCPASDLDWLGDR